MMCDTAVAEFAVLLRTRGLRFEGEPKFYGLRLITCLGNYAFVLLDDGRVFVEAPYYASRGMLVEETGALYWLDIFSRNETTWFDRPYVPSGQGAVGESDFSSGDE